MWTIKFTLEIWNVVYRALCLVYLFLLYCVNCEQTTMDLYICFADNYDISALLLTSREVWEQTMVYGSECSRVRCNLLYIWG